MTLALFPSISAAMHIPVETYAVRVTDDTGATLVLHLIQVTAAALIRFAFGADLLIADCSMYEGSDGSPPAI